ncbi:MAG: LPS assembly protein LptD [Candidatus Omnitrophica bacterium]|nr:LPS assembly protein LptD [Candidatus Omnitrophota bacterium]MBU4589324.1 LPS assembly protein LptD [Candidatus Omnitrophota bacterium]
MNYKIPIVFLIALLYFGVCYAEEQARPVEVNGDQVEYLPKEKKVVGKGNVSIDYGDTLLTCDKITVYTETKDADAEGNVVLKSPTGEVRGQRVKYNFTTKQGEILKPRIKSGEWYGGGDKGDLEADGSVRIKEGYITSCDREKPHYKIASKNIVIYPDNKVVAKNVFFKVGNVPVAYLPRYDYSLNADWPTINVIPGKRQKWGFFVLSSYRYELDENNKLTLNLDEREKWGFGSGLDYKYAFDDLGHGLLRTYYTHQRDMDRNENNAKAEEERFRVQLRHRVDINENLTALLEYHRASDVDFTKDYFYRGEYDSESSPESYFYLLDREPEYALSLLARKRVNRFQAVVERWPEARFDLKDQRLFDLPVYFKTDSSFTNLNSKTADNTTDSDVIRFDTYNRLTAPLELVDFLSFSPFAGTRDTFYSKDINGDEEEFRTAFYAGADLSAKFAKTYEVSGSFLGVDFDRLHHIVTPTIEYEYIHAPSMAPGNLQQFDDIDSVDRKSAFTLGFENRLQTKRLLDGKLSTVDLGYLLLTGDYLYKPENGTRFSNVKGDLELTPFKWLRIESDTQYDPATRDFQSWNADLYVNKSEKWQLGFGSRYWQDTEHELTSELFYKLSDEWAVRLFGRFDLKEVEADGHKIINRFNSKEITVIKDLHCWLAEVSLDLDRDGGATVWLVMKLKASPKVPFDFNDFYPHPKN